MAKNENPFDAVQMMRTIRTEIDEQMRGMTFDDEQAYIRKRLGSRSTDPDSDAAVASVLPSERGAGADES